MKEMVHKTYSSKCPYLALASENGYFYRFNSLN